MKRIVNILLRLNVWQIFALTVVGAVVVSVLLARILVLLFDAGSHDLLMIGAVVIPFFDAPIFTILLLIIIRELRNSRQQLDRRVKE